jgi:hypothetical protein
MCSWPAWGHGRHDDCSAAVSAPIRRFPSASEGAGPDLYSPGRTERGVALPPDSARGRADGYLLEHGGNRESIVAGGRCNAHTKRCKACDVSWAICPHVHATEGCRATTHLCRQSEGKRTSHPGSGHCWLHLGRTANGEKHAEIERVERAISQLGVPRGTGDPFALLSSSVQHAHGYLEASAAVVREATSEAEGAPLPPLPLGVALEAYEQAIRIAARTGKAAVDADVADRLAALDERAGSLLLRFIRELLDKVVPAPKRPAIEAWASGRLAELAAEYEQPAMVH